MIPSDADRRVVSTTWAGPIEHKDLTLGQPDPTPEELAIEWTLYSGVKPVTRVLEVAHHYVPEVTPFTDDEAA